MPCMKGGAGGISHSIRVALEAMNGYVLPWKSGSTTSLTLETVIDIDSRGSCVQQTPADVYTRHSCRHCCKSRSPQSGRQSRTRGYAAVAPVKLTIPMRLCRDRLSVQTAVLRACVPGG